MLEQQELNNYFDVLKHALKAKGMTYKQLADGLGISELSVKRLFRDKDCKLSRLLEICDLLEIQFDDLIQMQKRARPLPVFLPESIEAALAKDLILLHLLIHLISGASLESILQDSGLTRAQLYLHLRQLEEIGVIELLTNDRIRLLVETPIRWRLNGALANAIKAANQNFIGKCFDEESSNEYDFLTGSRVMTEQSIAKLRTQLYELFKEFNRLSSQDKLFFANEELKSYKLVAGLGNFVAEELFPLKELKTRSKR